MTVEELRRRKRELHMTNQMLAEKAGIPLSTVAKVLGETTKNPRKDTLRALEKVLFPEMQDAGTSYYEIESNAHYVSEPQYVYGSSAGKGDNSLIPESSSESDRRKRRAKLHTVSEYDALPADRRVELIDGRFYDLAAPKGIHQQMVFHLWRAFYDCSIEHQMPCAVQGAPFDVQIDGDEYTVLQPDLMVFCTDPSQVLEERAVKAPDLVCEVLSPTTEFRDRHLKLFKYRDAGVKEVWLVSCEAENVEVYRFQEGREIPDIYSFSDKVPVGIAEGRCAIDLSGIWGEIHRIG